MPVSSSRSGSRSHGARWQTLVMLTALAGVLLWAKLRLVSNMPRSVYADPKPAAPRPEPRAGAASGPGLDSRQAPAVDASAQSAGGVQGDAPGSANPGR
ncbi:MAG: hypothetical protein GIKADHBN_01924 [Phycisphaerales bacterium]|nr:hypothetical protein [Phycisphaerales bacterium]MCK6477889.1 hypothetical protein [Phycisphaerales bacterium]